MVKKKSFDEFNYKLLNNTLNCIPFNTNVNQGLMQNVNSVCVKGKTVNTSYLIASLYMYMDCRKNSIVFLNIDLC